MLDMNNLDSMNYQNSNINASIQEILSPQFDFANMNDSIMQGAVNGVASVFGTVYPDVQELPYFNNMAMESLHIPHIIDHDSLLYNNNFMWHISNAYGPEAVVGIIAHEVGHALTNHFAQSNNWHLDDWQKELCADYVSGIYTRMAKLDPNPMIHSYQDECWEEDPTHPGGLIREKVFEQGYNLADQDVFLTFELHNLHSILQNDIIDKYTQPEIDSFAAGDGFEKNQPVGEPPPKPTETIGIPGYNEKSEHFSERFPGHDAKVPFTSGAGICNFKCGQSGCLGLISMSSPATVDYSAGSQA